MSGEHKMTDTEFQRRWNGALTIYQAADAVGMSRSGAAAKAYRLRKRKGMEIKKFQQGGVRKPKHKAAVETLTYRGCVITVGSGDADKAERLAAILAQQLGAA